jgi:hypothetical protein
MNAVVFGKSNYANQILNDLSSFYGLLYPFDVVDKNNKYITVSKPQFPNIEFIQMLQPEVGSEIREKYDWIFAVNPNRKWDYNEKVYFGCFGECYEDDLIGDVETYDKLIFSSEMDKYNDSYKHYQEPLLHFTRNFHFYGFNFNPPLYEFTTFNNQREKPISFCYNSGLDGTEGVNNKRGFRKELVHSINDKYPNSIISPQKSSDFKKTNLMMTDYKNNGWYWDFNRAWATLVFETTPMEDMGNRFFTEKTFRGLMSGNALLLAVHNSKIRYLRDLGFWILNADNVSQTCIIPDNKDISLNEIEDIYHLANTNFESYKKLIENNSTKLQNNQRILYDWYYKEQDFKLNTIKWLIGE